MGQLVRYHPLPPEVDAAVEALNGSETFDERAFGVVNGERWKRAPIFLGYALPLMGVGLGLVWLADRAGWLPFVAPFVYAFFPIIFTGVTMNLIRGDSFKEEQRLSKAIGRWEAKGGRIRDKPLPLDKVQP